MTFESELFDLSLNQQFEVAKYTQIIDKCDDLNQVKQIAKLLLEAYQRQRSATKWVINEHLKSGLGS